LKNNSDIEPNKRNTKILPLLKTDDFILTSKVFIENSKEDLLQKCRGKREKIRGNGIVNIYNDNESDMGSE